jgi:hypothetical protein
MYFVPSESYAIRDHSGSKGLRWAAPGDSAIRRHRQVRAIMQNQTGDQLADTQDGVPFCAPCGTSRPA